MSDRPTVRSLHRQAMNHAQDGLVLLYRDDDVVEALAEHQKAATLERQALDLVPKEPASEPTLSILTDSAEALDAMVQRLKASPRLSGAHQEEHP